MIIRNRAKCLLCGEIVESTYTHDYKRCGCGALAVDGGHDYIRRTYKEEGCFEELSEVRGEDYGTGDPQHNGSGI